MPADSFVRIWKFIARPNLCETPACVNPQGVIGKRDSAVFSRQFGENLKNRRKNYKFAKKLE